MMKQRKWLAALTILSLAVSGCASVSSSDSGAKTAQAVVRVMDTDETKELQAEVMDLAKAGDLKGAATMLLDETGKGHDAWAARSLDALLGLSSKSITLEWLPESSMDIDEGDKEWQIADTDPEDHLALLCSDDALTLVDYEQQKILWTTDDDSAGLDGEILAAVLSGKNGADVLTDSELLHTEDGKTFKSAADLKGKTPEIIPVQKEADHILAFLLDENEIAIWNSEDQKLQTCPVPADTEAKMLVVNEHGKQVALLGEKDGKQRALIEKDGAFSVVNDSLDARAAAWLDNGDLAVLAFDEMKPEPAQEDSQTSEDVEDMDIHILMGEETADEASDALASVHIYKDGKEQAKSESLFYSSDGKPFLCEGARNGTEVLFAGSGNVLQILDRNDLHVEEQEPFGREIEEIHSISQSGEFWFDDPETGPILLSTDMIIAEKIIPAPYDAGQNVFLDDSHVLNLWNSDTGAKLSVLASQMKTAGQSDWICSKTAFSSKENPEYLASLYVRYEGEGRTPVYRLCVTDCSTLETVFDEDLSGQSSSSLKDFYDDLSSSAPSAGIQPEYVFVKDGQKAEIIYSTPESRLVRVNLNDGSRQEIELPDARSVQAIHLSDSGEYAAIQEYEKDWIGQLNWEKKELETAAELPSDLMPTVFSISPDDSALAVDGYDDVSLINLKTGEISQVSLPESDLGFYVNELEWNEDGSRLMAADYLNGEILMIDPAKKSIVQDLSLSDLDPSLDESASCNEISLAADGQIVAAIYYPEEDVNVRLLLIDGNKGELLSSLDYSVDQFKVNDPGIHSIDLLFSPDKDRFLLVSPVYASSGSVRYIPTSAIGSIQNGTISIDRLVPSIIKNVDWSANELYGFRKDLIVSAPLLSTEEIIEQARAWLDANPEETSGQSAETQSEAENTDTETEKD